MSKPLVWVNLDPHKVDVSYLEDHFKKNNVDFIAKAIEPDENEVIRMGKKADAIISIGEPWNKRTLNAITNKRHFIIRYGVGLDNIDLDVAQELGIPIANLPGINSPAVAEIALLHMLNLGRRFSWGAEAAQHGKWPYDNPGNELDGKIIGLVGFGRVPRQLVRLLSGFDVKIIAYDPYIKTEKISSEYEVEFVESMDEIFQRADIVSLHMPHTEETDKIINLHYFKQMKPSAYLVNTARGGLIDEDDLVKALKKGLLRGAGLDVLSNEPPSKDNPLLNLDSVFVTPHMGALALESEHRSQVAIASNIDQFLKGEEPSNLVRR